MAQAAVAYRERECSASLPDVRAMLDALRTLVLAAFYRLPFRVDVVDHDPYVDVGAMVADVANGRMLVWSGASEGLSQWDARTNWAFRAVHDWDHIRYGLDFSFGGEREAFRAIAARYPQLAPVLYSEIVLQAAYAGYYGAFAPQKVVML